MTILIGLHGKARSGKSTVADYLWDNRKFVDMAFASYVKDACAAIFGVDPKLLNDAAFKAMVHEYWGISGRDMLQGVGEILKEQFGTDLWTRRWKLDYDTIGHTDNIVASDVRFEHEADLIRGLGGVIVHIHREGAGLSGHNGAHVSEAGIVIAENDYVIVNDGTIPDLYDKVEDALAELFWGDDEG